jgi:hypothetical protein
MYFLLLCITYTDTAISLSQKLNVTADFKLSKLLGKLNSFHSRYVNKIFTFFKDSQQPKYILNTYLQNVTQ